ncbi:hypothetical protein SEA_INTERFOLIA_16 [Mycobacterium phage InterFolia]|nr:hypothetical protein SEA_INTERFOLIA_16 [Mycobacterium phage InterFolia]
MPESITDKRGAALAREILTIIEAEEAALARVHDSLDAVSRTPRPTQTVWNQGVWGQVDFEQMPPRSTIEYLDPETITGLSGILEADEHLVAISGGGPSCGTALCFAGHASLMVGDRFVMALDEKTVAPLRTGKVRRSLRHFLNRYRHRTAMSQHSEGLVASVVVTPEREVIRVDDRARNLLGLSKSEANALFGPCNTLADLRRYVEMMERGQNLSTGKPKRGVRRRISGED